MDTKLFLKVFPTILPTKLKESLRKRKINEIKLTKLHTNNRTVQIEQM